MNPTIPAKSSAITLVAAVLTFGAIAAAASDVAEHPDWKVGDRWTFIEKSSPPPKESKWTREVLALQPDGKAKVAMGDGGKTAEFDAETNSLDSRGPDYSWRRLKFPMSVGATWKYERKVGGEAVPGVEESSWKVLAYEKITVPAGTFDCYRVEGETFRSWQTPTFRTMARGVTRLTYWYCPAVKWVAKWETKDIPNLTAPPVQTVSELLSFEQKH